MSTTKVQPGWHPDPTGRHLLRFWDGERWTEQVSDPTRDPAPAEFATAGGDSARRAESHATHGNNDWQWSPASVVLAIAVVLVLCGVAALVLYFRDRAPTTRADASVAASSIQSEQPPTTTPWFPPGYQQGTGASSDFAYKFSAPANFQCQTSDASLTAGSCWQLVVITRLGCPYGVSVDLNEETTGNTVIGQASGSLNVQLAPGGRAIVQAQAEKTLPPGTTGGTPDISCSMAS